MITLGQLTRLAKHLGELIDRYFGTWSLWRVADPFDTETASSVFCSAYWHRCAREERRGEEKGKAFRGRVRYDGSWPTEAYRASRTVQSDGERAEGHP